MREKEKQSHREHECKRQKELTQDSTQKIEARVEMHMLAHGRSLWEEPKSHISLK